MKRLEAMIEQRLQQINPQKYEIREMDEVADFVLKNTKREFFVVGDYDVDGVTSSAILVKLFEHLGINCQHYLPKRFTDGYGLNVRIVDLIPEGSVLVTVDNGIVAFDAVKKAKEKGCDVIILDHHMGKSTGELPEADYIIDPHVVTDQCEFVDYCGAGLAYKLAEEVNKKIKIPFIGELQAIAGVGTIADCVSLTGENWLIAKEIANIERNVGLKALCGVMGDEVHDEGAIGFKIGPAINASGRLLDAGAENGLQLLLCKNEKEAERQSKFLKDLNENRKNEVQRALTRHKNQLDTVSPDARGVVILGDIPEGIVGIVAGRIAEQFRCPAVCCTRLENGVIKGSARSEGPNNNLKNILDGCSDLLLKYGGHKCAAGLSFEADNYEAFIKRFNELCVPEPEEDEMTEDVIEISPDEIEEAVAIIEKAAPYGQDNPRIIFKVTDEITKNKTKTQALGDYLKIIGKTFPVLCFDNLPDVNEIAKASSLSVMGYPSKNIYKGKVSYQMEAIKVNFN